jgi:hypothetical protein
MAMATFGTEARNTAAAIVMLALLLANTLDFPLLMPL